MPFAIIQYSLPVLAFSSLLLLAAEQILHFQVRQYAAELRCGFVRPRHVYGFVLLVLPVEIYHCLLSVHQDQYPFQQYVALLRAHMYRNDSKENYWAHSIDNHKVRILVDDKAILLSQNSCKKKIKNENEKKKKKREEELHVDRLVVSIKVDEINT